MSTHRPDPSPAIDHDRLEAVAVAVAAANDSSTCSSCENPSSPVSESSCTSKCVDNCDCCLTDNTDNDCCYDQNKTKDIKVPPSASDLQEDAKKQSDSAGETVGSVEDVPFFEDFMPDPAVNKRTEGSSNGQTATHNSSASDEFGDHGASSATPTTTSQSTVPALSGGVGANNIQLATILQAILN